MAIYTGDGLRAWKQNSGGRTYYLYDGDDPVCELGNTGAVTAVNTFGANGLLSRHTSAGSVFYTFDFQGDVQQRLGPNAYNILSSFAYNAFGQWQATGGADPFTFSGQYGYYSDADTGLVLCTHRYYDPSVGRWLTRDPMGCKGGINVYGYGLNNPVNQNDPTGLTVYFCERPVKAGPIACS